MASLRRIRLSRRALAYLRPPQALELLRLWLILLYVDLRLILLPLALNRAWLFPRDAEEAPSPGASMKKRIQGILPLIKALSRFRIRSASPCLVLALALRARLAPLGLKPALVYGGRRVEGKPGSFTAHAWLRLGSFRMDPFGAAPLYGEFSREGRKAKKSEFA
jgi:hypothetical protein